MLLTHQKWRNEHNGKLFKICHLITMLYTIPGVSEGNYQTSGLMKTLRIMEIGNNICL